MNICLILSGSIAAFKACELASLLVKAGHEVQTVASEAALRFVGLASLEGLTDKKVYTDLWAPRESKTHISLRRWTDLFVFYPATANRINAMAAGLAPDLIGATFLANNFEKPFWIAPAMNTNMLKHPATQAALATLEGWGCRIIRSDDGRLACGDVGEGRLAEPKAVFELIQQVSSPSGHDGKKPSGTRPAVLLTGGAMTEAIDGVRAISNSSSGRTASAIARAFLELGWSVDFIHHRSADLADISEWMDNPALSLSPYVGFADFEQELDARLKAREYVAIIHAAAVSDYRVGQVRPHGASPADGRHERAAKLESGEALTLELLPNPKLLPTIRPRASGPALIVAFKLTVGAEETEGRKRAQDFIDKNYADLVVWNDMTTLGGLAGGDTETHKAHPFVLLERGAALARGGNNRELALALVDAIVAKKGMKHE